MTQISQRDCQLVREDRTIEIGVILINPNISVLRFRFSCSQFEVTCLFRKKEKGEITSNRNTYK